MKHDIINIALYENSGFFHIRRKGICRGLISLILRDQLTVQMQQRGRLIQRALEPLDWYHSLLHTMGGGFQLHGGQGWKDIIRQISHLYFQLRLSLMNKEGICTGCLDGIFQCPDIADKLKIHQTLIGEIADEDFFSKALALLCENRVDQLPLFNQRTILQCRNSNRYRNSSQQGL